MIPEKIKKLMQKLLDNKFEAYIIGGAVRDVMFYKELHDYDIFTNECEHFEEGCFDNIYCGVKDWFK